MKMQLDIQPGHLWLPPFGLERVGRPLHAVVTGDQPKPPAGEFTLVTFPIYETDYLSGTEDYANAAFSARLDESSLPAGTYTVEVIVCGAGEPVSCKSPESTVVISGFWAS
jgi:hypothetical protein